MTSTHPHLLLEARDVEALRARAERSPWREWRAEAVHEALQLVDDPGREIRHRAESLARALSLNALAFLLDPERADAYVSRIVELVEAFDGEDPASLMSSMRDNDDKMIWNYAVPTGNAFVQAVLALDIIHDQLDPATLNRCEQVLRTGPARYFRETTLAWKQGSLAARAIWAIYERDPSTYRPIVESWLADLREGISADGVFSGGTGYAVHRWTSPDREHKALFGEILSRTGIVTSWYDEPRLRSFHEWVNGYAYTPFRVSWTIGDGSATSFHASEHSGPPRAYRYSPLAGHYSAWLSGDAAPYTSLGGYVLTEEPRSEPAVAPSRVFPDGGAWLKEASVAATGIAAVLVNLSHCHDGHAHKETNAVLLAAHGELLLRGGGYNGWNTGEGHASWEYIHDRAISASTVLLDYQTPTTPVEERLPSSINDHVSRAGAGVCRQLLTGRVDYAEGGSGAAIPNGHQRRSLVFVHPHDGVGGYLVTIDDLRSSEASTAQVVWHPASTEHDVLQPEFVHDWWVQEHSAAGAGLAVILATPAVEVTTHLGMSANWGDGRAHRYLVGHYDLSPDRSASILTVLYPHAEPQLPTEVTRTVQDGVVTTTLHRDDVVDSWFVATSSRQVDLDHPGLRATIRAGLVRERHGALVEWWLKDAVAVSDGTDALRADHPITIFARDEHYRLAAAQPTSLRVEGRGIAELMLDGAPLTRLASSRSWSATVMPGIHSLEIVRSSGA